MSGTAFTKPVTINAPEKAVVFDGCDFTQDALIKIIAADSVSFKNCRFFGLNAAAKKSYLILTDTNSEVKLVVDSCFFGDSPKNDVGSIYNLIELSGKLKTGSSISNNYFTKGCCTHNEINVYNVADEAVIGINFNEAEYSGNLVRIGLKGAPKCTINMVGNSYDETDHSENGDWAGLLLIQPYGKATTSMNDVVINLDDTVNKSDIDRILYLYAGGSDTHFNAETNYPQVFINGEKQTDLYLAGGTVLDTAASEAAATV